jgi:hypothetical protein
MEPEREGEKFVKISYLSTKVRKNRIARGT